MDLQIIVAAFVLLPLLGFFITVILPSNRELVISRVAIGISVVHLLLSATFSAYWTLYIGDPIYFDDLVPLYHTQNYHFGVGLLFDGVSATYLVVGSFITFLIMRYSQYYMHLEEGYKRYFNTVLIFFAGYNFTLLSGNFETLFMGWEFLGLSSFLLIGFYRERYLPIRNAVKVFSIYRIGDIGILAAVWALHHLSHENLVFIKLENTSLIHHYFLGHSDVGIFIGLALLTAAAAKSAQFPFSSWLPRAMEGPTPSSAIFYGSLSVHFGVFLLLRTFPLWQEQIFVRVMVGLTGLVTAIAGHYISQSQSSIKPQIAYASVAQIGLMFIEIALGWHGLVLIHFAGNAFLRTYQLLISPSIVNYLIRDQMYHFSPSEVKSLGKWNTTRYVLSMREWYLDDLMGSLFNRFKLGGKWLGFIDLNNILYFFIPLYGIGLMFYFYPSTIPTLLKPYLPGFIAVTGLMMVLRSFAERKYPRLAWVLIMFNHLSLVLAVSFNEIFDPIQSIVFLSGVIISGIIGFSALTYLRKREGHQVNLFDYQGYHKSYRITAFVFLMASLGLMGFPITPTFIGEDLLFSHIHQDQYGLALIAALSFVIGGIALIRIYARIFLGPSQKPELSHPYKTS